MTTIRVCGFTALALTIFLTFAPPTRAEATSSEIRALVGSGRLEALHRPDFSRSQGLLRLLYDDTGDAPLWLDDDAPAARAREAITALQNVGAKGLEPRDYDVELLADDVRRLDSHRRATASDLARFDVALSVAVVRLLSDLHAGRVDPEALHFFYDVEVKTAELPALVRTLALRGIEAAVRDAEPPFIENRLLQQQLAAYRMLDQRLTAEPAGIADAAIGPVTIADPMRPGTRSSAVPRLARWLAALGDLPGDARVTTRYEGAVVEAVRRFQLRHGLAPDGVVGGATMRALAVPPAARLRQIELALERLRWLPSFDRERGLFVNVPAFELQAFAEIGSGRAPVLVMPVVVGRAVETQTPFFASRMQRVVFSPYWNVPRSITRNEIVPKLRADPGYLAAEGMEIVSGGAVLISGAEARAALERGDARLRQRPGPGNALGRVKFLFPNAYSVYMHDTPARALFRRTRRDFSHGCIRVGDAAALARWVLAGEGWDDARVDAMLAGEQNTSVPVRAPVAVVIGYTTAVARLDGTISFYEDLYGHDVELERALAIAIDSPYRR